MLNFSIKLNNTQFIQLGKCIAQMLNTSFERLSYENYTDYFNLKSLYKKIFDKLYKTTGNRNNFFRVSISHNELRSLRLVAGKNMDWIENLPYENSLLREINLQANKQEINLISNKEHLLE